MTCLGTTKFFHVTIPDLYCRFDSIVQWVMNARTLGIVSLRRTRPWTDWTWMCGRLSSPRSLRTRRGVRSAPTTPASSASPSSSPPSLRKGTFTLQIHNTCYDMWHIISIFPCTIPLWGNFVAVFLNVCLWCIPIPRFAFLSNHSHMAKVIIYRVPFTQIFFPFQSFALPFNICEPLLCLCCLHSYQFIYITLFIYIALGNFS